MAIGPGPSQECNLNGTTQRPLHDSLPKIAQSLHNPTQPEYQKKCGTKKLCQEQNPTGRSSVRLLNEHKMAFFQGFFLPEDNLARQHFFSQRQAMVTLDQLKTRLWRASGPPSANCV